MSSIHARIFHLTFMLGLLSLALVAQSATVVNGQQRSRQELLKQAARLATEAERRHGEAIKKVRAGADPKLVRESEKLAADDFEKAVELWREAGHDDRLRAGVEELTRLYSVIGEYDRLVVRLTREIEYWRKRGNIAAEADMLFSLGVRQSQMKKEAAAIETLEQVVAMTRSARLRSLEANALLFLSMVYERVGRREEAESRKESANKVWASIEPGPAVVQEPIPPATIPPQWVDLPGAPAAAEYRVIKGVNEAVLVNRSSKGIETVMFGCVTLGGDEKVRVLHGLMGQGQNHGGVRPGLYYQPFLILNGPLNRWTDEKMGCEGAAKMTLIEATFDDRSTWKADGIVWTR